VYFKSPASQVDNQKYNLQSLKQTFLIIESKVRILTYYTQCYVYTANSRTAKLHSDMTAKENRPFSLYG